jgi:hypothetical protein
MDKRYGIRGDLIKKSHIDDHSSDELTSDPGNEDSQELYGKFLKTTNLYGSYCANCESGSDERPSLA